MKMASLAIVQQYDSIIVSQLPTNFLINDLKQALLRHFGGFGTVVRISCTSKNNQRTAHLQFSTREEAVRAQTQGHTMQGHRMSIRLTDKHPTTQLINARLQPLGFNASLNSTPRQEHGQLTLSSYFHSATPPVSSSVGERATTAAIVNEATAQPNAHYSGAQPGRPLASTPAPVIAKNEPDVKPNTCVKIELYEGPPSVQAPVAPNCAGTSLLLQARTPSSQVGRLRPTRSLSQILNLDTSRMKVINTATPSDALACQFFTGGKHPFPLAMMFGRKPGSVIMPLNSIMDKIKPGLEISPSTVDYVWNMVCCSVIKESVQQSANRILVQEKELSKIIPELYDKIEDKVMGEVIDSVAVQEIEAEEERLIICEDALEEIIGIVSGSLIKETVDMVYQTAELIAEAEKKCYRKMERQVVRKMIKETALNEFLGTLCEEVVDDLLESTHMYIFMKVTVKNALEDFKKDQERAAELRALRVDQWVAALPTVTLPRNQSARNMNLVYEVNDGNNEDEKGTGVGSISGNENESCVDNESRASSGNAEQNFGSSETLRPAPKKDSPGILKALKRRASEWFSFSKRQKREDE